MRIALLLKEDTILAQPIVMISSYPPRLCGIGTFCEEAREFIQKANPDRDVLVIGHTDAAGEGVMPLMDMSRVDWWRPVVEKITELDPYAIHIQHEYGLYEYRDEIGQGDANRGFLEMLQALRKWATIVEPHTVHGRLTEEEAVFVRQMCKRAHVVLFKCAYQRWRLRWTFTQRNWPLPQNIMIVPHGARADRRWAVDEVPQLREELGLNKIPNLSDHLVGLVGWIQSNKRWDIVTSMWEDTRQEIFDTTGIWWDLLAAGSMRDPNHKQDYLLYRNQLEVLERKRMAHFYEFIPRGDIYYKVMAVCDFVVLPSTDETQSGTLARIISLNKPYITTAPMEGLTSQTLESEGGLMFTNKDMLRKKMVRLACDEGLRLELGNNLYNYLQQVVSWDVVAAQYNEAYELARRSAVDMVPPVIPPDF
jgi:glycosyltransferase involved in cell wall biosynthesis